MINKHIRTIFPLFGLLILLLLSACGDEKSDAVPEKFVFKAADLSFLPDIESKRIILYNLDGQAEDMLTTLKNAGLNTVRIRLWYHPADENSSFGQVKEFAAKVRSRGLKVWLTVHYSDSWADPGQQSPPETWKNLGFAPLKDSVYAYTFRIMTEISPDFIQIGNEINNGMLWPIGSSANPENLKQLLRSGAKAVRDHDKNCKIMIHYAGTDGAEIFFSDISDIDYDLIGISYYPNWHGKVLDKLETELRNLAIRTQKPVMIAETSYPFTFEWNDWTHNVIGEAEQILPQIPASEAGQLAFMEEIRRISTSAPQLIGFAYWGGEWVAYKGTQAADGSTWENQTFYDFKNHALPVIDVFK